MYVWVLDTFQRDDEFCEHDSNIVAIYSEEHFEKAMKHFKTLCDRNILDHDEDEECENSRWKDEEGFHFSSSFEGYNGFKMNYVGLKKMEVQ